MATLDKHTDRRDWLKWAIEFMRRGLWLDDEITVHGTHAPPANYIWGEATARIDGEVWGHRVALGLPARSAQNTTYATCES